MKRKVVSMCIIFLLLGSLFLNIPTPAFSTEIYDFDKIWHHSTIGFNKNGDGQLVLAVTYSNATPSNPNFRNIDYASIEFYQNPFYFSITFEDELEIIRDGEGNIIYQEPSDGYVFLRKTFVDNYLPDDIRRLASKNLNYKTITFQSIDWYRIHIPDFNRVYEWKKYEEPVKDEKWYTWGSDESIEFETKAMYIKQLKQSFGHLEFDFTHPTDNSGQVVRISKSYLQSNGITKPYFEWGEKIPWKVIKYTENATHYFINPEHFSIVGMHEATSGEQRALIVNTTDDIDSKTIISRASVQGGNAWGDRYESLEDDWGEIDSAKIYYHSTPNAVSILVNATVGIADSSGTWIVNINENKSIPNDGTYGISVYSSTYDFTDIFLDNLTEYRLRVHIHWSSRTDCKWDYKAANMYAYGHADIHATYDYKFILYGYSNGSYVDTNRSAGSSSERNVVNGTLLQPFANVTCVKIKVPVSDSTQGISEVLNQTTMTVATNVSSLASLVNSTYYYDSANQFVYIGTENLSKGQLVNWSVNCTYGAEFDVEPPTFVVLGLPFEFIGLIKDANGDPIDGFIATTRIMYTNGTNAVEPVEYNCSHGNIFCTISTCSLTPGEYDWEVSFYDSGSGVLFKKGGDLSVSTGVHGHYDALAIFHVYDDSTGTASHSPQFTFYDPNMGIGINTVILKLYVSTDTTFTEFDRVYQQDFSTYTGQTIYYKVLDYFNNTIYPNYGGYASVVIQSVNQFIDIPIQMWMFSVKNMNHSIVRFELHNGTRAYQAYLFPYEPFYWYVFEGNYDINITYIDPVTNASLSWKNETIVINNLTYYWIRGYDLQDIILEVQVTNSTIGGLVLTITADITLVNSTVVNITTNILSSLTLSESNITTLINSYSSNYTIIESIVTYFNNSIWTNFTFMNATIDTINTKLSIDFNLLNLTVDWINNTIWSNFTLLNSSINALNISITTNFTMMQTNITDVILSVWTALNITNATIDSFNATIWTNFTLLQNTMNATNLSITNMILLQENNITSLIITIDNIIDYALMPDAIIWSTNPPIIISAFDRIGMMLGQDIWKVCPALNVIATTRNGTFGNWINSSVLMPSNGTVENGTITLLEDSLYIFGNGSTDWVNITYTDNRTVKMNGSYIPGVLRIFGENLTINASGNIYVYRETRFNQLKKFYWNIYNSTTNPGHIEGRAGFHRAGIEIINALNTTLYDVYAFAGFSDKTTPDVNTVRVQDVENDELIEGGENFKTTADGVDFRLTGSVNGSNMNASSSRNFVISYYRDFSDSYIYDDGQVYRRSFETNKIYGTKTEYYNYVSAMYINTGEYTFRGGVFVIFDFADQLGGEVDIDSIIVHDENNDYEVGREDYVPGESFVLILSNAVGDISPGSSRTFGIYFLESMYPGADPTELHFNTEIWNAWGMPITPLLIVFLICLAPIVSGIGYMIWDRKRKTSKFTLAVITLSFVILVICWILASKGY